MAFPDQLPPDDPFRETIELVERARGGDRGSVDRVLDLYYPNVFSTVRSRLQPKLRHHMGPGSDFRETLTGLVDGFASCILQDERSLIRWMSNLLEEHIRAEAKSSSGLSERERKGLEQLEAPQREVVTRYAAHERWSEIAKAMGFSAPVEARRLHARAKANLARVLEGIPAEDN